MFEQMKVRNHKYVCYDIRRRVVLKNEKLPPILKILREATGYTFKVPHGNKVRTIILEEGVCNICTEGGKKLYEITIEKW